jgi:hypothetical protein
MTTTYYVRYVMSSYELVRALDKILAEGHLESQDRLLAKQRHPIFRSDGSTSLEFIKLLPVDLTRSNNESLDASNSRIAVSIRYHIKHESFNECMDVAVGNVGQSICILFMNLLNGIQECDQMIKIV